VRPQAIIPSPTRGVLFLGPIPIRAYAVCIIVGIIVAIWVTIKRWEARGGRGDDIWNVAGWAVVFGIIGGRLYHVISDPELYFGSGRRPLDAVKIWDGGLGIWGAIALGVAGAWIGCRRHGMRLSAFADACAPGIVAAQGIGRWGNWFNNELYGGPTTLPWRLRIHCWDLTAGHAVACPDGSTVLGYFHPTFLYESIWDLALAGALVWAARRWRLGRGNAFALYVMGYTAGRSWIEAMRIDHANHILGLRLNDWTSIIVFLGGAVWFWRNRRRWDDSLYRDGRVDAALAEPDSAAEDSSGERDRPSEPAGAPSGALAEDSSGEPEEPSELRAERATG